ncbi:hypothetical protein BKI52_02060 [marine bacterium AO1-C]|nr:hypothetical protein BKI52_02060 [marine bacterium AO1-C]
MNTIFFSLLIALNFSGNIAQPTTKDCLCREKVQKKYLYQHWVVSPKESKNGVTVYRPYGMADANNIPMHSKYSGMEIKKGGELFQRRWRQCGNDTGPAGYSYKWQWKTQNNETLLVIKKRGTYKVLELSAAKLVVQAVK